MTYSLSPPACAFLASRDFVTVSAVLEDRTIVPLEGGIYGWYFDQSLCLPSYAPSTTGLTLLYVGISPSSPPKSGVRSRTLRDRLTNHCRGPIATSTLRRTLAALLKDREGMRPYASPGGKQQMSVEDETKLTAWMHDHARVTWMTTAQPWIIEEEILQLGPRLPLNIRGSSDPFRHELKKLRAGARIMGKENDTKPDPRRFQAEASDITMLGKPKRVVDNLTDEEKPDNEEHDRIVRSAFDKDE